MRDGKGNELRGPGPLPSGDGDGKRVGSGKSRSEGRETREGHGSLRRPLDGLPNPKPYKPCRVHGWLDGD